MPVDQPWVGIDAAEHTVDAANIAERRVDAAERRQGSITASPKSLSHIPEDLDSSQPWHTKSAASPLADPQLGCNEVGVGRGLSVESTRGLLKLEEEPPRQPLSRPSSRERLQEFAEQGVEQHSVGALSSPSHPGSPLVKKSCAPFPIPPSLAPLAPMSPHVSFREGTYDGSRTAALRRAAEKRSWFGARWVGSIAARFSTLPDAIPLPTSPRERPGHRTRTPWALAAIWMLLPACVCYACSLPHACSIFLACAARVGPMRQLLSQLPEIRDPQDFEDRRCESPY